MNTDDSHFDRLVDDELSEEERRELLVRLDDEPGGWRRCALAFLEAQCWKRAIGEVSSLRHSLGAALRPAEKDAGETPSLQPSFRIEALRRSPWIGRLGMFSAMAASFLVAMWLGSLAHRAWVGPSPVPSGTSANDQIAMNADEPRPLVEPNRSNGAAPKPWHIVTVSSPSDGQHPQRSIDVPAVERDNVDEQWARSLPPAIPDNVMQALNRTGHQVQQRRELVPVPLKDGRRLVVPVDRVEVHYVGNGPY